MSGLHFLEVQPDQKAKKEEVRFHWRKPGFFGGVGWDGGCSRKTAAAAECKLPSIPIPAGKAPDEMTPFHVLYSCRITISVALCFRY